ncbi:NAD-dependent protein deacetylase hst1 [Grifola frondosa]|uniref:NAD-dependent protein deacetylase hst1 n=1 Tax=Grifola frondosa TaxID=5627 RepID=A0A1C7MB80_GRIFR|nr:NAD-dependent protein deacetylase hst1 [Grifola frondosa]
MDHTTYTHPTHPHNSSGISRPRSSSIYGMQVHAFLDAADVVDADPEIIEDILDGFPADALPQDVVERDASNLDIDVGNTYIAGQMEEYADDFDAFLSEARSAWTQQEVKQMMTHLKERGMSPFINEYVVGRAIPIPRLLYAFGICLCKELRMKRHRTLMYFLKVALSRELQSREKLPMYNTIDDAINLIRSSKRILILTGAGISVSCGIPDFRSRNGLYATLQETGEYDLDDPQQMFDIHYFRENPSGTLYVFVMCIIQT